MKKTIFFSCIFIFLISTSFQAKAEVFSIHLYYNAATNTLSFDKLKSEPVSYDKDTFLSILEFNATQGPGSYVLQLYDIDGNDALLTEFDAKEGAFDINIPYFSIGASLKIFEKSSGKEILSANLSEFITCNGNSICEFEKGETALNCIGDCANSNPEFSPETLNKLEDNNGSIKDVSTGEVLLLKPNPSTSEEITQPATQETASQNKFSPVVLILSILILAAIIGFIIYKKVNRE